MVDRALLGVQFMSSGAHFDVLHDGSMWYFITDLRVKLVSSCFARLNTSFLDD